MKLALNRNLSIKKVFPEKSEKTEGYSDRPSHSISAE